jgi:hypothetical protein
MLVTDHDVYFAFAKGLGLDFTWARRLIDGEVQADPALAETLGRATDSNPRHWREEGQGALRLIAVKCWAVKERASGRLTRPALDVAHQGLSPRHCRACD